MIMVAVRDVNLPAQGSRSSRSRRSGGTVPAPRSSSSNDGRPSTCTAGVEGEPASAKMPGSEGGSRPPSADGRSPAASLTPCVSLIRLRKDKEEFYSPCSASLKSGGQSSCPQDVDMVATGSTQPAAGGHEDPGLSDASTNASGVSMDVSTDGREICLLDSDGETIVTTKSGNKRKRSRPPKEKNASETTLPGDREEGGLSKGERKAQVSVENFLEEFRYAPTQDLGAIIIEEMARVWHVSKVSRGLKGELSGALKRASCRTRAAVQALLTNGGKGGAALSVPSPPTRDTRCCEGEIAQLRLQLAEANRQLEELKKRLPPSLKDGSSQERKKGMEREDPLSSPPSPQLQPKSKRARRDLGGGRKRVLRVQFSSEGEDSDGVGENSAPKSPTCPEEVLPPRSEWPPALRPAVQGKRKDLDPLPQADCTPQEATNKRDLESRIMAKMAMMFEKWSRSQRPQNLETAKKGRGDGKKGQGAPSSENSNNTGKATIPGANLPPTKGKPQPGNKEGRKEKARNIGHSKIPAESNQGPAETESPVLWTAVVGRKAKRNGGNAVGDPRRDPPPSKHPPSKAQRPNIGTKGGSKNNPPPKQQNGTVKTPGTTAGKRKGKKRPPRCAAVVVTCPEGQYGETLRLAREKINLADLGIEITRPKRALTGALILEIPGGDGDAKADRLAARMREALAGKEGVRISRPRKMKELRIRGLDESIAKAEIIGAVVEASGCQAEDIQLGETSRSAGGLYSVWLKCPLDGANRLTTLGHLKIGWSRVRVEALEERPLQCYKCLEKGHVRARCPLEVDRADLCYRCGMPGHQAKACTNQPSCIICREAGRKANHRLGGAACKAPPAKKKREGKKGRPENMPTTDAPKGLKVVGPAPPPMRIGGA